MASLDRFSLFMLLSIITVGNGAQTAMSETLTAQAICTSERAGLWWAYDDTDETDPFAQLRVIFSCDFPNGSSITQADELCFRKNGISLRLALTDDHTRTHVVSQQLKPGTNCTFVAKVERIGADNDEILETRCAISEESTDVIPAVCNRQGDECSCECNPGFNGNAGPNIFGNICIGDDGTNMPPNPLPPNSTAESTVITIQHPVTTGSQPESTAVPTMTTLESIVEPTTTLTNKYTEPTEYQPESTDVVPTMSTTTQHSESIIEPTTTLTNKYTEPTEYRPESTPVVPTMPTEEPIPLESLEVILATSAVVMLFIILFVGTIVCLAIISIKKRALKRNREKTPYKFEKIDPNFTARKATNHDTDKIYSTNLPEP